MRDETYLALMARAERARYERNLATDRVSRDAPAMAYLGPQPTTSRTPEERGMHRIDCPGCSGTRTMLTSGKSSCNLCDRPNLRAQTRARRRDAALGQWRSPP